MSQIAFVVSLDEEFEKSWKVKPHLRESNGKISSVRGFQKNRLRLKPGHRVVSNLSSKKPWPLEGTVVSSKELTAKVKWDTGLSSKESIKNLKKVV